jgi:hypothetical protein
MSKQVLALVIVKLVALFHVRTLTLITCLTRKD